MVLRFLSLLCAFENLQNRFEIAIDLDSVAEGRNSTLSYEKLNVFALNRKRNIIVAPEVER